MTPEQKIQRFISKRRFAFIGSVDKEGFPNVKVMLFPRKTENSTVFYFSTNTSSRRVEQFRKNPKACLYFCSLFLFKGVMLRGKMDVLQEQSIKDELWQRGDTKYYPKGVTDPNYCVLRFTADERSPRTYRI